MTDKNEPAFAVWQKIENLYVSYNDTDDAILIVALGCIHLTSKKRFFEYRSVSHWMPLPNPPLKESEGV